MKNLLRGKTVTIALGMAAFCMPSIRALCKDNITTNRQPASANTNLCLIENRGQITDQYKKRRNDIDFKIDGGAMHIFVGDGQVHYQWNKVATNSNTDNKENFPGSQYIKSRTVNTYRMDMILVGANKNAKIVAEDKHPYYENYYLPNANNVKAESYKKVTYKNIYPNIDWVLYCSDKGLKYDFIVNPGGKVSDIKMRYDGATSVKLTDGALTAETPFGSITEQMPFSYEKSSNKQIASSFTVKDNVVSFNTGEFNETLVIDPVINWTTYFGNVKGAEGLTSVTDTAGYIYLCGTTMEDGNIASIFSYQETYKGAWDAYILKLNPNGTSREWSTYYGGDGYDAITTAVVDKNNRLVLAGYTTSTTGISTTGTHQTGNGGDPFNGNSPIDGFVTKFTSGGSREWGTYYGGLKIDMINSVTTDKFNFIIIGGFTNSVNGTSIFHSGSFQSTPGDGFIAKLSPTGNRSWGTYYNGEVKAVACDGDEIIVGGKTSQTSGISTVSGAGSSFGGGTGDGFIGRFLSGGSRQWGRYYGGTGYDGINAILIDSTHFIYAAGSTSSTADIATTGSHQPAHSDPVTILADDGFIAKFTESGTRVWGTYYGGDTAADNIYNMYMAPDQNIYIAGVTGSNVNIATPGSPKTTFSGPYPPPPPSGPTIIGEGDAFLVRFTTEGVRKWGTYFGGEKLEKTVDVCYGKGKIYLTGSTGSKGLATPIGFPGGPPGAFQDFISDTVNTMYGFITQFQGDTTVYTPYPYTDTALCMGGTFNVRYKVGNTFKTGNTFSVQLSNISGSFFAPTTLGTVTSTTEGTISCTIPTTGLTEGRGYKIRVISTLPADTFYNYNIPLRVSKYYKPIAVATPDVICMNSNLVVSDFSSPPPGVNPLWTLPDGSQRNFSSVLIGLVTSSAYDGDYILENDNYGCKASDTVTVKLLPSPPDPVITGDTSICIGGTMNLFAMVPDTTNLEFQWIDPTFVHVPKTQRFILPNMQLSDGGVYKVGVNYRNGCPSATVARTVVIRPLPSPAANNNTPICLNDTIKLMATDTMAGVTYSWVGPNSFKSNAQDTSFVSILMSQSGVYTVTTTSPFGCKNTANTLVELKPLPDNVDAVNNGPLCSGNNLQLTSKNATPGAIYSWTGPGGFTSLDQDPNLGIAQTSMQGEYKVEVDLNGCKAEDTTFVTVYQTPDTPQAIANSPLVVGSILKLKILNPQLGVTYDWIGPNGFTSTQRDPVVNSAVPSMAGLYTVTAQVGQCSNYDTVTVVIVEKGKEKEKFLVVFPNPNNGVFKILGETNTNSDIPIMIYASDGKLVHTDLAQPKNNAVDHTVDISKKVANGVYRVKMRVDGKLRTVSLTVGQ